MGRRCCDGSEDRGATVRDLRVAQVVQQDLDLGEGGSVTYRVKLQISFKYEE